MTEDPGEVSRRGLLAAAAGSAAAVGAAGAAGAQEGGNNTTATPTGNGTATPSGNQTADGGGQTGGTTHQVDMTDQLVYEPAELTIAPGDTVAWTTVGSQGHTVTAYADGIPEGATYFASGGFGSELEARANTQAGLVQEGETYEHTFQTTGEYEYFCIPHEAAGMVATLTVQEGGGGGGGGGGGNVPSVPDTAKTLGIAALAALLSTLGLAYAFLKYGGDFDVPE